MADVNITIRMNITRTPGGIHYCIHNRSGFVGWADRRKRGRIRHARMLRGKHTQRAGKL